MSNNSYREIFKATSLFGGVQIVSTLAMIIRAKFVAVLVGPEGMGIFSLLASTLILISTVAGLGLNYSVIRDISKANESKDYIQLSSYVVVFKRLLFVGCFLGSTVIVFCSRFLSDITFGNSEYTFVFMELSLMLIFTILTSGNIALLQGTRNLKYMAKSTIYGAILSVIVSVPFYYFFGTRGIAPSLIAGSMATFLISMFFANKVKLLKVVVNIKETFIIGKAMISLGLVMVISQLLANGVVFIMNTFIRSMGSIADVGFYQAGTMITTQSIGLVFAAMAVDYYPRLIGVSDDNEKIRSMVNEQGIVSILISLPLLTVLVVFAPLFIHLILTPEFYIIANFIRWLALGMMFTAPTFVIGYIALAKGDKKNYFLYNSVFNSVLSLIFNIIGYKINGLIGMAISYCIFQFCYCCFIYYHFNRLYSFSFNIKFLTIFITLMTFCIGALLSSLLLNNVWAYILGAIFIYASIHYAFFHLKKLLKFLGFRGKEINMKSI